MALGQGGHTGDGPVQLFLQSGEAVPSKLQGIAVELQVETPQFRSEMGIPALRQNPGAYRGRLPIAVHQEELLLGPHPARLRLDLVLVQHLLKRAKIVQQRLHVVLAPAFT